MTATALIIDDEPDIRELVALTLTRMGLDIHTAANLEEARHLLSEYKFDVCLTDMRLPDGNGVEFVRYIQSTQPNVPVAVITAHGNMEAAVEAMKNGAYDFVPKPVDIHQLRRLVVQAVSVNANSANDSNKLKSSNESSALSQTNVPDENQPIGNSASSLSTDYLKTSNTGAGSNPLLQANSLENLSGRALAPESSEPDVGAGKLIGSSALMQELRVMIGKLSRTNAPVWITGESGTGKELIARLIHENSPRANAPFVAINCGAIPSELMESELFGHKKGSFTGAHSDHDGLFRRAEGGTLFLDEVAELPLHMQVKLLRAIQERTVRAVGGSDEIAIDARILSASHKDLAAEVEASRFRHDLYYRLNVICLRAPSLRERPEDIPQLADHILNKLNKDQPSNQLLSLSDSARESLENYSFLGNVRELENILERASALCDTQIIQAEDLQLLQDSSRSPLANQSSSIEQNHNDSDPIEKERIVQALNATRWNRKLAAETLGLTYRQLRYRIQQYGIDKTPD